MFRLLFHRGWITLFACMHASALHAQQVLTRVSEVRALGAEKAQSLKASVKLRGVVTFVNTKRNDFKLDDGTGGVGVRIADGEPVPDEGKEVEVEGYTNQLEVQSWTYPHVHGSKVVILGERDYPKARAVSVGDVATFRHYDQWVSVEGVVVMWTLNATKLSLYITGPEEWVVVHLRGFRKEDVPKDLNGSRVRVTGVNLGSSHSRGDTMIAPTKQQLEILTPGTTDIFGASLVSIEDVVTRKAPPVERIRIKGVVTAQLSETILYVRDGDHALCAELERGWGRSAVPGMIYGDNGKLPELSAGDEVEVVGSITPSPMRKDREAFALTCCHVKVTGKGEKPVPVISTLADVAAGAHTFDLVQIKGTLVHLNQVAERGRGWRTSMKIEEGGVSFDAVCISREAHGFAHAKLNDEVMATGLVDKAYTGTPRQLWVVSPADVRSLGLAPAVRERQMWLWTGSAGAVVLFLGIWITTLSRALNRQRDTDTKLRELNTTLEDRVRERTTQLEASQRELERALKQEKELGELKTRFVTMVSHEFRTPLGITMSAVELMRHYEDKLPGDQRRELCNDIYSATRSMAGLMEQVLVLGRVEAGKLGFRPMSLDLNVLAGKLTDESLSATNRKCPIVWKPHNDLSGAVADESLLRHIFGNLVTNAVKYSPAGSEVIFAARRERGDVVFEVIDRGIGIPEQDREQLFEAFHRCSNVGEVPGTGLGLVIVKRCVELHGGSIEFQSETGKGTTFIVRLPVFVAA